MITVCRLRFLLTSHGFKHVNTFKSRRQGFSIVTYPRLAPARRLRFDCKNIEDSDGSHSPAVKGQMTLNCRLLCKRFCTLTDSRLCWNCGSSSQLFFCSSCNMIQPPDDNVNYFDILNCEQCFSLDMQKLQKRYIELQRSLHPDNFSQKSSKEQEFSEKQSALVNKAYRTLQKPLSRAIYMLELQGVLLEEGTDATVDPAFLSKIMEVNESLAETHNQDEVNAIGQSVHEKLKDLTEQMNSSLNKGDLLTAKGLLAQMKYFTNIEEKVKERLSQGW